MDRSRFRLLSNLLVLVAVAAAVAAVAGLSVLAVVLGLIAGVGWIAVLVQIRRHGVE